MKHWTLAQGNLAKKLETVLRYSSMEEVMQAVLSLQKERGRVGYLQVADEVTAFCFLKQTEDTPWTIESKTIWSQAQIVNKEGIHFLRVPIGKDSKLMRNKLSWGYDVAVQEMLSRTFGVTFLSDDRECHLSSDKAHLVYRCQIPEEAKVKLCRSYRCIINV